MHEPICRRRTDVPADDPVLVDQQGDARVLHAARVPRQRIDILPAHLAPVPAQIKALLDTDLKNSRKLLELQLGLLCYRFLEE